MLQEEFDTLVPAGAGFKRRDFVRNTLGTGFAAAVLPVMAQTVIHTDSSGLTAGEVRIPVGNFRMPAYRAAPTGRAGLPLLLVVHEAFGVHEHIADVVRRFAKAGYFAVAPQLFARQGDAASYTDVARLMAEVVSKVPDAQVMGDLDACSAWAGTQGADTDKSGLTGFCWGGRIVWLYSARNPSPKASVAWYGRLVGTTSVLTPANPIDVVASLQAPVLGLYGGQDGGITQASVETMRSALAAGSDSARHSEIVVYPDAGHAFNADNRPSYRKDAAEDGWRRCLAWFKTHGVA